MVTCKELKMKGNLAICHTNFRTHPFFQTSTQTTPTPGLTTIDLPAVGLVDFRVTINFGLDFETCMKWVITNSLQCMFGATDHQ